MFSARARIRAITILVIFSVAFCVECAASGRHGDRRGEFDPLGFPGDDTVLTGDVEPLEIKPDTPVSAPLDTHMVTAAVDSVTRIRVQFFATTSLSEAEDVLGRAVDALKDSVALEFETPYYKLKAGPLPDEEAARRLVLRLRRMGYEAAWVVRERVAVTPDRE